MGDPRRPGARSGLTCPLEAIGDGGLADFGGKAVHLARLIRLGLPVPPGFCLSTEAYRRHLESGRLRALLEEAVRELEARAPGERAEVLARLREAIIDAPVPAGLPEILERGFRSLAESGGGSAAVRVAVRSSATAEDLKDLSFAGLHDTILGVSGLDDLLRAVRRCWASLWTERAFEYRKKNGIRHLGVEMAVIVQRLVPAEVSGVLFTADPVSGRAGRLVIESAPGLGEALVSGKIPPDRLVLARPDLAVLERSIAPEREGSPSLGDDLGRRLARISLEAERGFGHPLDIEWALSGGEIFLLQARAITSAPAKASLEDRQVWSNSNAGEVAPDVMTPMTWSLLEPLVKKLLGAIFTRLGMDLGETPLFGLIAGRVYFNINTALACLRRIPGLREKDIEELFGGRHEEEGSRRKIEIPEEDIPDLGFSRLRIALRLPGLVLDFFRFSPGRAERILDGLRRRIAAIEGIDLRDRSDADLARAIQESCRDLLGSDEMFRMIILAPVYLGALYDLCRRWLGEEGNALAGRLLAGLGNNDNARAGLDLLRLAALARESPQLEAAVLRGGGFDGLRREIADLPGGPEFLSSWDAFLREHGHHCRGEVELANPRWSEEPERILEQVRGLILAGSAGEFLERYGRLAPERERAAAECRKRLRNPLKRIAFRFILGKAQRCAPPFRENMKSLLVRWCAAFRRVLLELGDRMARRGALRSRDDVFFLKLDELEGALMAAAGAGTLEDVAARRAEHERNLALSPPPVIKGRFDPSAAAPEEAAPGDAVATLHGVPIHPGLVTGKARVILRAGEDRVLPGEVLVAPFTDPGWTPYFLNAAALVVDMGGILSHGSIIAREYGIPAVVNVGPATRIIRTGRTVQVDGARGIVRILD